MFVARQLKEKNIAEYLLYMWQVEDIIRAHGADMQRLEEEYLSRFELPDEQRAELKEWYTALVGMMREEGVVEKGHVQVNRNIIILLSDLHRQLLASPRFPFYHSAYYKALPHIVALRGKGASREEPELENCFEALYGLMLLKLSGKTVSEDTAHAMADITRLLAMLADFYTQDKAGTLKFD